MEVEKRVVIRTGTVVSGRHLEWSDRFEPLKKDPPLSMKFVSAGLAACGADLVTFPIDTAKVRLQIQGETGVPKASAAAGVTKNITGVRTAVTLAAAPEHVIQQAAKAHYRGLIGTLRTIASEEGTRGWYKGLVAGLHRQMCFASVRIGLYEVTRDTIADLFNVKIDPNNSMIPLRITAGIITGGCAVLAAQPTDVVKVRMQADVAKPPRYSGTFQAYRHIGKTEGLRGLWKGTAPNVMRNAVVNAAELVSYDLIKTKILYYELLNDNLPCHFVSAFCAGFITTICASPVDVIKTRIMNSKPGQYKSIPHAITSMWKEAGFFGFYKGFVPNFMRLGSWNILTFVLFEQFKRGLTHTFYPNEY